MYVCSTSEFRSGASRECADRSSSFRRIRGLNTRLVIPLTSNTVHADSQGNVFIPSAVSGLPKDSVALIHQMIVVDTMRLEEKIARIPMSVLSQIDAAIDYVTKE